jgi:hypothetical protein
MKWLIMKIADGKNQGIELQMWIEIRGMNRDEQIIAAGKSSAAVP